MMFHEEKGMALCGLACVLCSEEDCPGCREEGCKNHETCTIYQCAKAKGLEGCWQCEDFPCGEGMFGNMRLRAFNRYAQAHGSQALLDRLRANCDAGITYHRPGGLKGDYDGLQSEEEIQALIHTGRFPDPFDRCPVFETEHLRFALIDEQDATDLFRCYTDPVTLAHMNIDNCGGEFRVADEDVMRRIIVLWRREFDVRFFIRWTVHEKLTGTALGTIEIAPIPNTTRFNDGVCGIGILRVDLISTHEQQETIAEVIGMVADNFYNHFGIRKIIMKALPGDAPRVSALLGCGFERIEDGSIVPFADYYAKERR